MKQLIITALALALVLPFASRADARSADRAVVERALSAYEYVLTRAQLLRLGDDIASVLRAIVEQPGRKALARNRALSALRYFPSKATERLLVSVIVKTRGARRGVAVLDLGQAAGSYAAIAGKRALKLVEPLLAHRSIDARIAAAEALRLTKSPRARGLLFGRLSRDSSPTVRAALSRQIGLIDRVTKR